MKAYHAFGHGLSEWFWGLILRKMGPEEDLHFPFAWQGHKLQTYNPQTSGTNTLISPPEKTQTCVKKLYEQSNYTPRYRLFPMVQRPGFKSWPC